MKSRVRIVLLLLLGLFSSGPAFANPFEIHTIHAPFGIPAGTPTTNDLIFRNSYTVSTNDATKFADWVAYRITPYLITEAWEVGRNYVTDPVLGDSETLEERSGRGDYSGAFSAIGVDRGHLVPRASFLGSRYANEELNYLSIFAPQTSGLNRGPWLALENSIRGLAFASGEVFVLAGPYYTGGRVRLPEADEPHVVPDGFYMIVYDRNFNVAAFLLAQGVPQSADPGQFITSVDAVERATGLDFFTRIDPQNAAAVESAINTAWYRTW